MNLKICNQAGRYKECKTCTGNTPNTLTTICPFGPNYCITKLVGTIQFNKKNGFFIQLEWGAINHLPMIDKHDLIHPDNIGKSVVCWLTDAGIELMRFKTY